MFASQIVCCFGVGDRPAGQDLQDQLDFLLVTLRENAVDGCRNIRFAAKASGHKSMDNAAGASIDHGLKDVAAASSDRGWRVAVDAASSGRGQKHDVWAIAAAVQSPNLELERTGYV